MTSSVARIIVVEDDDSVRDAIVGYLSRHDLDVTGVPDARGFDALTDGTRADLIILDVMLPGEDGLSLCRRFSDAIWRGCTDRPRRGNASVRSSRSGGRWSLAHCHTDRSAIWGVATAAVRGVRLGPDALRSPGLDRSASAVDPGAQSGGKCGEE